jgi:hypothetical protein
MKLRLLILLAAALAASPAAGQTIKSLGYNTTNGVVPTSLSTNTLRFTNAEGLQFNKLTTANMVLGTNGVMTFYTTNSGFGFSAGATAAQFCDDLGLGATNNVTFSNITANGIVTANDSTATPATNAAAAQGIQWPGLGGSQHAAIYGGYAGAAQIALAVGTSNSLSDVATFSATGMTVNSNAIVGGTLAVSNAATFATNVTVNGNLSVGSFTTTTPSTWALDATQTAAATNGVLDLPSNANVIRLTNNNAISGVSGGVLGAFYYLVNQTTNAVTISNVGGITVQGGTSLTLGANQAATLVATGATNASVAARGDLTDVTLGGTLNIAPAQTADSGASLMTRDLSDERYTTSIWLTPSSDNQTITNGGVQLLAPSRFNSWSVSYGASVPSGFTEFRVVLSFGWLQNPATNSTNFPVFVLFQNRNAGSASTKEAEHGTAFSRTDLYPTNAASTGLAGTLTRRAVFNTTNTVYSFISDWVTIPNAWQSNASSNGFYHVIGAAIANNTGDSITDGFTQNHAAVGLIEFRK